MKYVLTCPKYTARCCGKYCTVAVRVDAPLQVGKRVGLQTKVALKPDTGKVRGSSQ